MKWNKIDYKMMSSRTYSWLKMEKNPCSIHSDIQASPASKVFPGGWTPTGTALAPQLPYFEYCRQTSMCAYSSLNMEKTTRPDVNPK